MHRGHLWTIGLASLLVITPVAQARPKVSTDAVPGVNFSAYQTYSWINSPPPSGVNPVMYERIQADIEAAMAQLGYREAEDGQLSLALTIGAQQKTDIESWGRFGLQTSVYQYVEGQLSLDVFDSKTKQALWHGQVSDTVHPSKPNQAKVDAAIAKLMQQFPATAAPAAVATPPAQ